MLYHHLKFACYVSDADASYCGAYVKRRNAPAVVLFIGCTLLVLGERLTVLRCFAVKYEMKALQQRIPLFICKQENLVMPLYST
jgi:hypothetical protein